MTRYFQHIGVDMHFELGNEPMNGFAYTAKLTGNMILPMEVIEWCGRQFGSRVRVGLWSIRFQTMEDRDWFLLRWS